MTTISINHKGLTLTKNTKRVDVTHVVVAMHKGEYKIVGLHKNMSNALKDVQSIVNPAYSEAEVVSLNTSNNEVIESGETGPDWEPTKATKYYAQLGTKYAFGSTIDEAIKNLKSLL